ncbi:MAG: hypothetical protein AAF757_11750 [Cyanobacteria bacterium P01_D01_bin.116]
MYIRAANLTRNQVKRLFGGILLCLSLSLTVACQQTEKSSSDNNSQDSTVQSVNPNNNQGTRGLPQRTPGEVTVNLPTPLPSVESQPTPTASPNSVARVPQNPSSANETQVPGESDNSIPRALTEKLSPQAATRQNIPQPKPQVETRTTPSSPKPVVQALRKAAKSPGRRIAAASNTNVYRSRRLGVNFKYPKGFVIKEPQNTSSSSASKVLELWSLKDYQAIESGKFKNTFTPGNMSISVENNPQGLSLVQWVTNNDELGDIIPESYDTHVVAGKEAMSFRTDGLYNFQNLVLPNSDGKKVILISFAQGDRSYQQVFEQVVSTLQVN